ncbi:MAG TPA: glycoside hydrolase family 57 protein [Gammaproteobacteria bacterium]|nr:glycoside hydrolase family 57 protein [Gammaproteobacteria bacterium]
MARSLDLVFLWHMHQPDYRAPGHGDFTLPWTYLHAMKDYADMAAHFERHPEVRAVVNFVPVLLDQIEDYATQIARRELRDPLLRLLAHPRPEALDIHERRHALAICFRAHRLHAIDPFPAYQRLHAMQELATAQSSDSIAWLSGAYFADLVTWYHLAWTGEATRRALPLVAELMSKGEGYTHADRLALLDAIGELLQGLLPRYRALAARGQIELSTTPHAHPIAPLLLSFDAAREAVPDLVLPLSPCYPGGRERLDLHLTRACDSHRARFGAPAAGLWPAEGAVSTAALARFAAHGVGWAASGETVLAHTLGADRYVRERDLYRPWHDASGVTMFFRDDRLSDLIGFEYAKWHGRDAARHFITELEGILARTPDDATPLVSVILDGENAWEYYPYNAYWFFEDLYAELAAHPQIRTTTLADALAGHAAHTGMLPPLVAGSWVYGTLTTWIGDPDKNHAWDLLCSAKQHYDLVLGSGRLDAAARAKAEAQLAICEGSDWFWWLGDCNPADSVASFEALFRRHLRALYDALGLAPPAQLDRPLSVGGGHAEVGGTMRRSQEA